MRPRTLALLFVLVAGLLAFIWFYERELPSSDERVELARKVLRLEPDEVRAVTLDRGEASVRLERAAAEPAEQTDPAAAETAGSADTDAAWWLREPLEARADRWAVESLVDRLTGLEKERTLEEVDAETLGLAAPRGRVVLETDDGPVELLIGSKVPASSTMILAVAGSDEAYVVADTLWSDLEKPAGDWRSRDLGPESREAIQRIALSGGVGGVTLGRRGTSFWVESPYVDRADGDLTSELLAGLTGLRVESFVDEPQAAAPALGGGTLDVVLEGREDALRIELGGPAGAEGELRLARVGGQLVEIRTRLDEALERPAEEWRARSWTSLQVHQIDRLETRDAAGETVFTRDGGEWLRDGARVEYEPVSELLYALTGIEAAAATDAAPPSTEPRLTLVLAGADNERRETLSLYPADEKGASPARVDGREVTLMLDEGAVADLELKLAEARTAEEPSDEEGELESLSED